MVLFHEEEGEEAYCSCGHRIPRDWLKKTVDEIKEQQYVPYWDIGPIARCGSGSENFRSFVEYMGMLQKVLTLVHSTKFVYPSSL